MNEKMERLLTILQDVNDEIDFAHERHMVDDGLIDSLELMKIIVALEEAYDVRIDAGEVEPENFNSAEAILALVNSCRKQAYGASMSAVFTTGSVRAAKACRWALIRF